VEIPWIFYADAVATALPLGGGWLGPHPTSSARRWILSWTGLLLATNLVAMVLALQGRNNHWLNYLVTPIAGALVLWGLSHWQKTSLAMLAMRLAVPLLGITWIGIVIRFENTKTFSLLAEPFAGLLILAASIYTLTSRAFAETGNLFKRDWFWIAIGMALYSGVAVALPPASHWLLERHPELVIKAYEVKAAIEILALLLISRGMLCPIPAMPFGGSFSQGSSPSPSSSSASSSRW
jgi:hypothetical protein